MTSFNLFDLPTELVLMVIEQMSAADLASFLQTSKTSWRLSRQHLTSFTSKELLTEFVDCIKDEDHMSMVSLSPILRRLGKTDHVLGYDAIIWSCTVVPPCPESMRILIADSYETVTNLEKKIFSHDDREFTAMHVAIECESPIPLEVLVEAGASLDALTYCSARMDSTHQIPDVEEYYLHHASIAGATAAVRYILSDKYANRHLHDINRPDPQGNTPLILTARQGTESTARVLVSLGAKVNLKDADSRTALSWAARYGHDDIVSAILGTRRATLNASDDTGKTALHHAAKYRHTHIVSQLIAAGSAVNLPEANGQTPLFHSVFYGWADITSMLLARFAAVNVVDSIGRTPLHWAATNTYTNTAAEICEMLLENGADANALDNQGSLALRLAIEHHNWEVQSVLLEWVQERMGGSSSWLDLKVSDSEWDLLVQEGLVEPGDRDRDRERDEGPGLARALFGVLIWIAIIWLVVVFVVAT